MTSGDGDAGAGGGEGGLTGGAERRCERERREIVLLPNGRF